MSPDVEALRAAAVATPLKQRIDALDRCFRVWQRPDSPWLQELSAGVELYSPQALRFALRHGLAEWTGEAMHRLIREEAHGRWRGPSLTAVWLGGSIPNASFAALALPLLVGSAVIAKTARHDRVSPTLFQRSLRDADPTLATALHVTDENEIPALADAMVVYGSDATVSALRSRCAAGVRFVGHGHKLSAAAVGPDAELEQAAGAIAIDLSLFDGRGCLSPAHIFVDASDSKRPERFMELLCDALRKLAVELPRGRLDDAEHALLREVRARLAAVGRPLDISPHGTDWAVWLNPPAELGRPGLLRHVGVSPVSGLTGLEALCSGLAPHLSSLAVCGWDRQEPVLTSIVHAAGGSRICEPGQLQLPRLNWRHDGMGAIEPLLRSVEIG